MTTSNKRHQLIKPLLISTAIFIFVGLLFDLPVSAAGTFNAMNLIGQLDRFGAGDYFTAIPNRFSVAYPLPNVRGVNGPEAVALDTTNRRLFVADANNNRVLVFNLDGSGNLADYDAHAVIGQTDYNSNASNTTEWSLSFPSALAYDDATERLFVADTNNNRVLVYDASVANLASEASGGGIATNAINVVGQSDFASNVPNTTQNGLSSPFGLAFDNVDNRLFVSDYSNSRVMVFDVSLANFASSGNGMNAKNVLGQPDFISSGGNTTQTGLSFPVGVAFNGGSNLFVADSNNNRVMVFDVSLANFASSGNGMNAEFELGQNDSNVDLDYFNDSLYDTSQSGMAQPKGVAYSSSGTRLFVADTYNSRVLVFDVSTITNGQNATNVLGQTNFSNGFNATAQNRMSYPNSLTVDGLNNVLYVADTSNNRALLFDVTAPITDGANATNLLGQVDSTNIPDYTTSLADNQSFSITTSTTSSVGLNAAHGVAHDESGGKLFVADTGNNRVVVYTGGFPITDGTADIVLGQPGLSASSSATTADGMRGPQGVAYDAVHERLFVADTGNNRVLVFDGTSLSDGMAAQNVLGQSSMTASASATTATGMNGPTAVAVSDSGAYLYVADTGNNRILIFDVGTVNDGEAAVNVIGQSGFTTSAAATTQSGLDAPSGLAFLTPNLFVADTSNNRVMVFDVSSANIASSGNGMNAENVLGQANFTVGTGATTQDGLSAPSGLAVIASASRLAVADTNNNRVIFYSISAIVNGDNAVQTVGQTDYVTATSGTTQVDFSLSGVSGLTYSDSTHNFYVVDAGNHRVMEFGLERITQSSLAAGSVGSSYSATIAHTYGSQGTTLFTLASGSLPPGLSLGSGGSITGTPTTAGAYSFTVMATNTIGPGTFTDTKQLSIAVSEPYRATDLIGQLYDDTDMPRWTGSKSFDFPNGLGVQYDETGSVLDAVHHRFFLIDGYRILVYNLTASNTFSDYIADNVLGTDSVYSQYASFPASATRFGIVEDIAYDSVNDRLFVVDKGNNRVLIFDTSTITNGESAVYVFGQTDFTSTASGLTARKFNLPQEAAYDPNTDRLYVTDGSNNRALVFDASPANLASDGNGSDAFGVLGQPDFTTKTAGPTQSKFGGNGGGVPYGLTLNAAGSKLYVVDSDNHRVLRFDVTTVTNGENAEAVLGQTLYTTRTSGLTQAKFNGPEGVALDEADNLLFVGDRANCRVMVFDVTSITNGENAVNVLGGSSSFTTSSCATGNAGSGGNRRDFFYPNKLYDVYDVEYDSGNKLLYVTDRNETRVVVYNIGDGITDGEAYINTVGVTNSGKQPELYGNFHITGRGLGNPGAVALDTVNHQLFVVDVGDSYITKRILRYQLDSNDQLVDATADSVLGRMRLVDWSFSALSPTASTTKVTVDSGLAVDEVNDRLFVADSGNNRVMVFNIASVSSGELASYVLGQTTFTGASAALTRRGMSEPMGLAFDPITQRLFVADNNNKRVLVYDVSPTNLASDGNGSDAIAVLGQADFTTASPGPAINRLGNSTGGTGPSQLAYDASRHKLYVGDPSNYRVMVFDVTNITDGEDAINVLGQTNFTNGSYPGPAAWVFGTPEGMAFDPDNNLLWVLDSSFQRATVFDVASITNGESPIGLIGQTTFTESVGFVASQRRFYGASGLALDAAHNRLYAVSDSQHRAMIYEFLTNTTTTPASGSVGELYTAPLSATGNQGTLSFIVASGSLPPGLSIVNAEIVGTPSTEGTYPFTLRAVDTYGVSTFVDDASLSIVIGPSASVGGGHATQPPQNVGFMPLRIAVNEDDQNTDSRNVLVDVYAQYDENFSGTVDVLLSNTPDFASTVPFRYVIDRRSVPTVWNKTIAWDLCFGLPATMSCDPGKKIVYARFYVNVPSVWPALTPLGPPQTSP